MQMLAAVLLAATVGTTGGATIREQTTAATAVWAISLRAHMTGEFVTASREQVSTVITRDDASGSGFMVSPDGFMLTARHLMNPAEAARDMCQVNLRTEFSVFTLNEMRLDVSLRDIVGNLVIGRITVLPRTDTTDICADPMAAAYVSDEHFPFRIVAIDPMVDVALVKVEIEDVPFLPLGNPAMHTGDPVYALGFSTFDTFARAPGTFEWPCERVSNIQVAPGLPDREPPALLTRIVAPILSGMSGGPLIAHNQVIGVVTNASTDIGYSIPAGYLKAWYEWVRGQSLVKPETVCEGPRELLPIPSR